MPRVGGALTGENPLPHDPPALGLEGLDGGRDARKVPLRDVVRLRARLRDLDVFTALRRRAHAVEAAALVCRVYVRAGRRREEKGPAYRA